MTEIIQDITQAHLAGPSVLTIGSFDGVHRGHQYLIDTLLRSARERDAASIVVTLSPHPKLVLRPDSPLQLVSTVEERIGLLSRLGLDYIVVFPFTIEHSRMRAREFVGLLVEHLRMVELVCGPNFALGFKREGDVPFLRALGAEMGFQVTVVEPREYAEGTISSTRVRDLVAQGAVTEATVLLGHYPALTGSVVHGDHRGRALGFPTANLDVPARKLLPADGIYAVRVRLGEEWFDGAANIGVRPQFGGGPRLVEVHILDFDRDIHGQELEVHFVERMRSEMKFESVSALVEQIKLDVEQARRILQQAPRPILEARLEQPASE